MVRADSLQANPAAARLLLELVKKGEIDTQTKAATVYNNPKYIRILNGVSRDAIRRRIWYLVDHDAKFSAETNIF